ncbi:MAG: TetR family transcriptional regulator [Frankiales bacterium]|nr:TetR family transcriptional regulator [Frankiales bacterium]
MTTSVESRREGLLRAADAVVQREGAAASMAAMAAEAGVTKPILYRHFGDKAGLYAALAARHTETLMASLTAALAETATPKERVRRTVDVYLAALEADPQVYSFLVQSEEAAPVRGQVRGFLRQLQEQLSRGISAELGLPTGDARAPIWAAGIVGMVQSAGDWWLEARSHDPLAPTRVDLSSQLTELLWGAYGDAARGAQQGM